MTAPSSQVQRWPALHLYSVNNDIFTPRILRLANRQHQKIRSANNGAGAVVNRFNGNIKSLVLSNPHADIWEEDGKIFIKDMRSTHGTTVTRACSETEVLLDSSPYQLHNNDIIKFGRDFVNTDTGITHPKVIARVLCVLTARQAQEAVKPEQQQDASVFLEPQVQEEVRPERQHAGASNLGKRQSQDFGGQGAAFKRTKGSSHGDWNMSSPPDAPSSIIIAEQVMQPLREEASARQADDRRSSDITLEEEVTQPLREEASAGDTKEFGLLDDSPDAESISEQHEMKTAPIVTRGALVAAYFDAKKTQYGVLGKCTAIHSKLNGRDVPDDSRLYINTNAPFSAVICGLQGSGKSHTLSVILENMLIPDYSEIGTLAQPLAALVLHYGQGGRGTRPNEAAWVGVSQTPGVRPPPVRVYVSHSSLNTMRAVYAPLGRNVAVEPLFFTEDELDAESFLSLMSVDDKAAPLYIQIVLSILRDLGENFRYSAFQRELEGRKRTFHNNQIVGLEQRMSLLEAFMHRPDRSGQRPNRPSPRFAAGRLTIVDLSDPFIDSSSACGLFEIITRLFVRAEVRTGKCLVVDEAHKYLTTSRGSSGLTKSLLTLTREQRHLAMRVLICTQEPTVIPPVLLDLCTVAILHRFASPSWWNHLTHHVSADFSGDEAFDQVVKLQTGEALVLAPSGYGVFKDTKLDAAGRTVTKKSMGQFGRRYMLMKTRQRVTADGGASVLVLKT